MTIVTAIDGEDGSEGLVANGRELADAFGEELVVVHVVPSDVRRERGRERVEAILEEALEDPDAATVELREGDPAEEIVEVVGEQDTRYVVVGTRKRTPIGQVLFGSVTQLVMANTDVPAVNVPQSGGGVYPIETGMH